MRSFMAPSPLISISQRSPGLMFGGAVRACGGYRSPNGDHSTQLHAPAGALDIPTRSCATASSMSASFSIERSRSRSLPIGIGRKSYGRIVLVEDPQAEAFASEELDLMRTLIAQLSGTVAALRAEQYEQLVKAVVTSDDVIVSRSYPSRELSYGRLSALEASTTLQIVDYSCLQRSPRCL